MPTLKRYAVYFAPRRGSFALRAAEWLGRDAETGEVLQQPFLPELPRAPAEMTVDPRRYGFHGTIRAPFRLADDISPAQAMTAIATLARNLAPAAADGLEVVSIDGFLALVPIGDTRAIADLAAAVVSETNALRAALNEAEIARRRPESLSPHQRALLDQWGYPYVMDEFQFHLTLTDRLAAAEAGPVANALRSHFAPVLPKPFVIEDLCLFGEGADGQFHLLHRYPLSA